VLRFRPEDLFAIEVWFWGRQQGWATPRRIARHVHWQAPPPPEPAPIAATGIDYLGQVLADHEAETSGSIAYPTLMVLIGVDGRPWSEKRARHREALAEATRAGGNLVRDNGQQPTGSPHHRGTPVPCSIAPSPPIVSQSEGGLTSAPRT